MGRNKLLVRCERHDKIHMDYSYVRVARWERGHWTLRERLYRFCPMPDCTYETAIDIEEVPECLAINNLASVRSVDSRRVQRAASNLAVNVELPLSQFTENVIGQVDHQLKGAKK